MSISTWSISPAVIKNQLLAIVWVIKSLPANRFSFSLAADITQQTFFSIILSSHVLMTDDTQKAITTRKEGKFVFLSHLRNLQRDVYMHTLRKLSLMSEYWNFVKTLSTLRHEYMKNRMRRDVGRKISRWGWVMRRWWRQRREYLEKDDYSLISLVHRQLFFLILLLLMSCINNNFTFTLPLSLLLCEMKHLVGFFCSLKIVRFYHCLGCLCVSHIIGDKETQKKCLQS